MQINKSGNPTILQKYIYNCLLTNHLMINNFIAKSFFAYLSSVSLFISRFYIYSMIIAYIVQKLELLAKDYEYFLYSGATS